MKQQRDKRPSKKEIRSAEMGQANQDRVFQILAELKKENSKNAQYYNQHKSTYSR